MKKMWFEKGRTGAMLRDLREKETGPFTVTVYRSTAQIQSRTMTHFVLTVRGSSHCRRKQSRSLERWLNKGVNT